MGLIEQEIKEIRQQRVDQLSGKISKENAMIQLAYYSQTEKRLKLYIQTQLLGAKFGKPVLNRIIKSNLIGDGTFMKAEDLELELIKCPDQDKLITRNDCLDYSGASKHYEDCHTCENYAINRKLLLPESQQI